MEKMINIAYLSFGENLENHQQVLFSALSLMSRERNNPRLKYWVVTDSPESYACLKEKINIVPVNDKIFKEWRGEVDFFWRIKIKALEALEKEPGHLFYMDSDTFWTSNLSQIVQGLEEGKTYMHLKEGDLCKLGSKTEKKMWSQMRGNKYGNHKIDESSAMWNAGVIAIPEDKRKECIQFTLNLCDDMCKGDVTRRLLEQFSFSLSLTQLGDIHPASKWITHYWGNKKEWNNEIAKFFTRVFLKDLSFEQMLDELALKNYEDLPIVKRQRRGSRQVASLGKILFPDHLQYHRDVLGGNS